MSLPGQGQNLESAYFSQSSAYWPKGQSLPNGRISLWPFPGMSPSHSLCLGELGSVCFRGILVWFCVWTIVPVHRVRRTTRRVCCTILRLVARLFPNHAHIMRMES